ncbi:hypothetical protein KP509_13G018400 [Ceratopteris richardii]|uniref:Uncharacterized protein n=1 Tax=Ceratopteris richardii TaxID=49495 RepID=A0A8T2TDT5_CERRI|nr:hypothetical protein KP509_13G018400 [Ceratopteris richardii]
MENSSCVYQVLFGCIWIYTFCHFSIAATGLDSNTSHVVSASTVQGSTSPNSSQQSSTESSTQTSTPSQPPQPSTLPQLMDTLRGVPSPPPQAPIILLNTSSGETPQLNNLASHRRGKIVGVIFLSFAGMLQLGIAIFLIIRRHQILDDMNGLQFHRLSLRFRSNKPSTA